MKAICKVAVSCCRSSLACLLLNCLGMVAFTSRADAAIKVWDGSGGSSWGTATSWTNNAVPVNGDDLIFPAGAGNKANNNNIAGLNVRSLTFTDSGYTLSGNTLTLSGTNGIV